YPQRDEPYLEDIGRRRRAFTVEGYVLGPEYFEARDALIRACETSGAGTLVHPFLGALTVSCTSCRVQETTREGGMARFTLSFAEAGENRFPAATVDTRAQVLASA